MRKAYRAVAVAALGLMAQPALAQVQLSPESQLMLEAGKAIMKRDFAGAASIYSRIIAANPNNIEAYLQRGIVRREAKDEQGAQADAVMAVRLANAGLQASPNSATLYHERGMGYRLLKDYPHARADIQRALQLSGNAAWQPDLQAIALEERMNP